MPLAFNEKFKVLKSSVADPGFLARIRFFHPGFRVKKIPGYGFVSKN